MVDFAHAPVSSRPSFLGSVLKAIAATPNRNADRAAYDRDVLEPARRIRKLAESLGQADPSEAQVREVLALLRSILDAKGVDPSERDQRLAEIHGLHGPLIGRARDALENR